RGELLGLCWSDIDFITETINIERSLQYATGEGVYLDSTKSEKSDRSLKLSPVAFSLLREYKQWQDDYRETCGSYWQNPLGVDLIFTTETGNYIHPDSLTGWFGEFIKRTDLPSVCIHSLRHTCASIQISDGVPLVVVSKRLGHAQVSTTANIYAHVIQSADERAAHVIDKFADVIIGKATRPLKRVK
ncbi:MAG: site-specific integrase, partial [Peptococcaceae bacterium]|nr:site-specific integrase [Peptococcaceae bacterium]